MISLALAIVLACHAPTKTVIRGTCATDSAKSAGEMTLILYRWRQCSIWAERGAACIGVPACWKTCRQQAAPVQFASVGGIAPGARVTFTVPDSTGWTYAVVARFGLGPESCLTKPFVSL